MIQQPHCWPFCPKKAKTLIRIDICTPILIAALFTIDKTWKQPKCPWIDECIKMWYICDGILLNHKKEWKRMLPFMTTWISLQSIMLTEINQRKTNTEWFHLSVEPKKNKWINITKQRQSCRYKEETVFPRGEEVWGKREIGEKFKRHKLPVAK